MIPVDSAFQIILNSVNSLNSEEIDLLKSEGRFLYKDIISTVQIPPFNNSAMDGYAVQYEDTLAATSDIPVFLDIIDEIQAGMSGKGEVIKKGQCIRIMTGAPVPAGINAVIPVENIIEHSDRIEISKPIKDNANIRSAGEDISTGQVVLRRGDRIDSAEIGLLASLNCTTITVFQKPRVAVISTGDEIVDLGTDLKPGQIHNSNAYTLISEITKYGADADYIGVARDTVEDTTEKYTRAMECDIIVTTGGVSMGKYDFVKDVMKDLGVDIRIEKIKMKPGKPLAFGTKGNKLFFGLPGNPVSTMIAFLEFVRPAILSMMGSHKLNKPLVRAILTDEILKKPERMHFIRGYFKIIDGVFHVSSTGPQGSGILRSMSEANCLIILPEGLERASAGDEVYIELIKHEEI